MLVGGPGRFRHLDAHVELGVKPGPDPAGDLVVRCGGRTDGIIHEDGAHGMAVGFGTSHQEPLCN
jgi:hypothetical protein